MVIVAIMVGGGLFGVPGMIVGVPVFAVLNAAVWKLIGRSLDEKICLQMLSFIEILIV